MNAPEFYRHFASGFALATLPPGYKKLAGKTPKWKYPLPDGVLHFKFSTNFKASGLLEQLLWPGEFRLILEWQRSRGNEKNVSEVSPFQYTNESEIASYCALQRHALEKYFNQRGEEPYGPLAEYLINPLWVPTPNTGEWCYYFDSEDAKNWGAWYGNLLALWTERFLASPETLEDWCWRVLWPHLQRNEKG